MGCILFIFLECSFIVTITQSLHFHLHTNVITARHNSRLLQRATAVTFSCIHTAGAIRTGSAN